MKKLIALAMVAALAACTADSEEVVGTPEAVEAETPAEPVEQVAE